MTVHVIILAAGQGTRMNSSLPKVLHPLGGLPLLGHVIRAAQALNPETITVVLPQKGERIAQQIPHFAPNAHTVKTCTQITPDGTGGAVRSALATLPQGAGDILVLCGDTPVLSGETLTKICAAKKATAEPSIWLFAMRPQNPSGYGRVMARQEGGMTGHQHLTSGPIDAIVEDSHATPHQRQVDLCNTGVILAPANILRQLIQKIKPTPPKNEYYLTDMIHLARTSDVPCFFLEGEEAEFCGVNTRMDLAAAEAALQHRWRTQHMKNGVTLMDPPSIYFSHDTVIGRDSLIFPHVFFGIGVTLGERVTIRPFSMLQQCQLDEDTRVGPCAHLRPGTHLEAGARVGNFVEVKKATLATGSHVDHLSYIGDSHIGAHAAIGAGTITCNYNGHEKFPTQVGAGAFVGSHTTLIAPVRVGDHAIVAAGSVITRDVSENALAFARAAQSEKSGYAVSFHKKAAKAAASRKTTK